jgi:hypothetical protein
MSLSLIEILTSLTTLALLLGSLIPLVGQGLEYSQRLEQRTQLLANGARSMAIVASRIREACYLWPPGAPLVLGTSPSTRNTTVVPTSSIWKQGEQFLALILPPSQPAQTPQFLAYYPMLRSHYLRHFSGSNALQPHPKSDGQTWVLIEYRRNLDLEQATTCLDLALSGSLTGGQARLFADQLAAGTDWMHLENSAVTLVHRPDPPINLVRAVWLHPTWLLLGRSQTQTISPTGPGLWAAAEQQWWGGSIGVFRSLAVP